MRVIIVSNDTGAVGLLRSMLSKAMHIVEVFDCAEMALRANAGQPADCIIADWLLKGMDGVELARQLKLDSGPPLVLMSELSQAEARQHALQAGAVAYMLKPLVPQCVVSAILAVRKASSPSMPSAVVRALLEERLMKHPVWTTYEMLVAEWMRGSTGLALQKASDASFDSAKAYHQASLAMVDVATSAEVYFSLRLSRESARGLAAGMLGVDEIDDPGVMDLLCELCNNLLGQAKTNFHSGGFEFALGTPDPTKVSAPPKPALVQRSVVLAFPSGNMHVTMGIRIVPPMLVRARDLVENMVVVEDVKTPQGALLVPAGTRLTSVVAQRVTRYLADREVRVAMVG